MVDMRTMSELLQAPTEGYGDAIRDDPHAHIRWFNKITSTLKYKNVLHDAIKLMLFSFSLEGASRIWLEKEPSRSILTWEDLVSKFVNYFFPPSKTTNLKNDITNFQQKFDETFSEAWDRFKDLLCKCPHHGFLELHQIDTFYNALTQSDQDSLNAAAGVNTTTSSSPSSDITALTDIVKELVLMNKANQQASVKVVEETCVTCGGPHPYYKCLATDSNTFNASAATWAYNQGCNGYRPQGDLNYRASNQMGPPGFLIRINEATLRAMQTQLTNMKMELRNEFKSSLDTRTNKIENQKNQIMNMLSNLTMKKENPSGSGSLPSNTIANSRGDLKAITTRSGVSYDGPTILPITSPLPKEAERELEATKDKVKTTSSESIAHVQPPVVQVPIPEPEVAPKPNPKPSIPYPLRLNDQKLHEKANNQMLKFLQIFQILHFDFSFVDALLHMPKFASTFKSLLSNKEKLFKLANTPYLDECLALADLGASINLMPLSVWKKLSLSELTPTRMTLELANRLVAIPLITTVDPWVPLILGRPFLRTSRALIDVHGEELTLR
ncbi:reverse transcriptase domain-containing protein, partial [Tanacetum coccineum]